MTPDRSAEATNPDPTFIRKPTGRPERAASTLLLPPDLLRKVRSRVKLAAALVCAGFVVDPLILLLAEIVPGLAERSGEAMATTPLSLGTNLLAVALSTAVWAIARSPRTSQRLLLDLGLAYEVVICLVVAFDTHRYFLTRTGELPHLTWVVAIIILFPLILPSPPRRMLLAAIAAALTSPLSLLVLQAAGQPAPTGEQYVHATLNPALSVVLAYFAARVVYGLNVDVVQARRMGSYHLVERLGRGGMGEVWRAEHHMLARPAAIKLIPAEMLSARTGELPEVVLRRFEREARATACLRSPHTVDIYDFGSAEDGTLYYVMELLEGMDLETLVARHGPVAPGRAVHILLQACHSLAEAHERDLVHRDIKPANIFICRYGREHDFVKVLDFGLVKARPAAEDLDPGLTAPDVTGGTPAFMAPEQALGGRDVDGRADIYALGCVAYWLLTGRPVFESGGALEMITHHVRTPPEAPSRRTEIDVPAELDRIVLDCLRKSPDARPASAVLLADRLAAVRIPERWTPERAAAWWDAHLPADRSRFSAG